MGVRKEDDEKSQQPSLAFSGLAATLVKKKSNTKATGYSKMAKRHRCGSLGVPKDFVQATMRFVLVNSEEDGGCQVNHDGHFDSELEELEKYGLHYNLTGTPVDYLEAFFDSNALIPW